MTRPEIIFFQHTNITAMSGTRSSARLARAKIVLPQSEEPDIVLDSRPESEYNGSDDEEIQRPVRKRPRTTKKSVTKKPAKPPAKIRPPRGKLGRLAGLMNMPIDIFTEIASYLLPADIIVLSRLNKFFRGLLMNKSSAHVWHSSMRNVKGLPPCPEDLSIPHYLNLLFSKNCSMCGGSAPRRMDEILHVRFCAQCRPQQVMQFFRAPHEIFPLLNKSSHIVPSKRRYGCISHVLQSEVDEVHAKYCQLQKAKDKGPLEAWKIARRKQVEDRAEKAKDLTRFLDELDNERERELNTIKHERKLEIERRLIEIGWESEDMKFNYFSASRRSWYTLVEQARPLTDRIWENLRPKLTPLLKANREERLEREKVARQSSRKERLIQLLTHIKSSASPLLQFSVLPPTMPASSSTAPVNPNTVRYAGIFPDYIDALEWPVVKELFDNDTEAAQFEAGFEQHRAEIDVHIAEWKVMVETRLADKLREGRPKTQDAILNPTLIVTENDADPFADISDNLKYLLRADSFFHPLRPSFPLIFDVVVANGYTHTTDPDSMRPNKHPLNLERCKPFSEARVAARKLLESIGKPDACYLEMRSVGQRYVCDRCHDTRLRTWEEIVQHYVTAQTDWNRLQPQLSTLAKSGIVLNNVHDPARLGGKPLFKCMSTTQLDAQLNEMSVGLASVKACRLCLKPPINLDVHGPETAILTHLHDVHNITEPKLHEHYDALFMLDSMGSFNGLDFDLIHSLAGEFFSDDEPMFEYDSDEDDYPWGW